MFIVPIYLFSEIFPGVLLAPGPIHQFGRHCWDILQELVYEERREPFANLKDLQNVIRDK